MKTMKKILFFAAAITVMASCTSNEFVGDPTGGPVGQEKGAISFSSSSNAMTRADYVGADAAALLNNKFIVGGFKSNGDVTATAEATGTVFNNYIVNWEQNTAATTESNTSDWEYVGVTAASPSTITGTQTIKYWDYSMPQYDFIAYSLGKSTGVTASIITPATAKTNAYTLTGPADELTKCYIADMVTAYKDGTDASHKYQDEVKLSFRSLGTKVRVALYETIPGYSVKDVKFYTDDATEISTGASATDATLFTTGSAATDKFYPTGTYTVSFPTIGKTAFTANNADYNQAHVTFAGTGTAATTKAFGALNYTGEEDREAAGDVYLGRHSNAATYAGTDPYYTTVLPNETGAVLELRIDYTLLSIDGSGEIINVHGAKAFVPSIYAKWLPNYAYTYIFKISDNTNGWTSTVNTDPAGLYPITFDAVVAEATDYKQSTITTVASPSITTYQKGHDISKDEYSANTGDIYVQVIADGTLKGDLDAKGKLYTLSRAATEAEVMDALNIQTASDATSITGRNTLVLTTATSDASITAIPGEDGNDITVVAKTAAKFTPAAPTGPATVNYYAYVYDTGTDEADTEINTAVIFDAAPTDWATTYSNYYTDESCTTTAPATFPTLGAGEKVTYYQKYTNLNKVYGVKVIKVVA